MLEALQNLDGSLLLAIQSLRLEALNPLVEGFTRLGNAGLLWIVLSLAMLVWRPTRKAGLLALVSLLLGLLCTNVILKHLVGRERPWLHVAGLIPLVNEPDPNSFPSGHTCAAFAAGMGLSRLYVGVHYPSDVLAGAAVGAFCAWDTWKLYQTPACCRLRDRLE